MLTDSLADAMTRVRNAQRAKHAHVNIPYSKLTESVLKVLGDEGFIGGAERRQKEGSNFDELHVELKYYPNGDPAIGTLKKVSTPGRRIYVRKDDVPRVFNGLGIAVISTSQGVMSDRNARAKGVGGELLATVS